MSLKWKLVLVCLEIVPILTQDWCTVCAEHTIGSRIILDALDGTPRWRESCGILFWSILEMEWASVQDRCLFESYAPQGRKSFWLHPMVLLGDEAQVEVHFGPFGDSVNLDSRYVHDLRQTYHRLSNRFGRTRWYSLMMTLKRKLILIHLKIVLILTQDKCTVCTKHTIGS
jgi:hypothetical protein